MLQRLGFNLIELLMVISIIFFLVVVSPFAHAEVTFDWATVGNAGNAADTTGYGAVSYQYRISKYEVTNAQYAEFLNAVATTDTYNLYNANMGSNDRGGIARSGSDGSYSYSTKSNMANKPVNYVTWYDAARFTNWLHNGQGAGATESGVYDLSLISTDPDSISRAANANYFLPSEDEWYKAAYHDPVNEDADGNGTTDYWLYATRSDADPTLAIASSIGDISNPGTNVVNYDNGADWNGQNGNVTTVGTAGPGSESFYGTSDQTGSLWEWTETLSGPDNRVDRGGGWSSGTGGLKSSVRGTDIPVKATDKIGFRIASPIPEPGSILMLTLGAPLLLKRRRD